MKWLLDENFNNDILRGITSRHPNFDTVRAQDLTELRSRGDVALLD